MDKWLHQLPPGTTERMVSWGLHLLAAIVIFLVGLWLARLAIAGMRRLALARGADATLTAFLMNIAYAAAVAVVVIAALDAIGINTTSLLAVLGAAGLAVGLALQGSLSNFAAGVMLILFRPFRSGDYIEAAGVGGTVDDIRIFQTALHTPDNRDVVVPNAQLFSGVITNYSTRPTRRIDLVVGISYDDDIAAAREVIRGVVQADERILADPAPVYLVTELADSSVNLGLRAWVSSADYLMARSDLLENIKNALDGAGISIPYPQRQLHHVGPVPTTTA
ncbi:MAG TPA: mechanosensitive ion channel domain-containing protein [Gammaproteobacteria bacterium]|nr:mechanosensitive ion channel domain-containing protein [Gammaproteobacteria bacterium]